LFSDTYLSESKKTNLEINIDGKVVQSICDSGHDKSMSICVVPVRPGSYGNKKRRLVHLG
jgi:hypothetical protein